MLGCIPSPQFRVIHRSLLCDAIQEKKRNLLTEILDALKAKEKSNPKQENDKATTGKDEDTDLENISKIVDVLEKLGQVHREHNEDLMKANENIKSPGVKKVAKMREKIESAKENLGPKENKVPHLLDQPNSEGKTLMHFTAEMDDDEATKLLLNHGANPNVQDAEGNSILHTLCSQKDIQTTTSILKSNGKLLANKELQMPAIEELFFDQEEEDVRQLMEAIDQSNHKKEILDKILGKEHLLFTLVEKDKSEILSIVLDKLSNSDQEDYVNLVRYKKDGNTALHLSTISHRSLKCASLLLEAGARLATNVSGHTPPIEDFFTKETEDEITTALVDGLVERVKANQLDKRQALQLLIPEETKKKKKTKVLFQLASRKHWTIIAEWAKENKTSISNIIPQFSDLELGKMVLVAKEGHWEKDIVNALLCEEDKEGAVILSRLQVNNQRDVAAWNQKRSLQIAHKMSPEFMHWLISEANEGRWNGEELGAAFCEVNEDRKLKLATVDEELQKKLAVLNKTKTCLSVPMLGRDIQQWLYQEALEGRWNQDMVFRVLESKETEEGTVVSSRIKHLGTYIKCTPRFIQDQ